MYMYSDSPVEIPPCATFQMHHSTDSARKRERERERERLGRVVIVHCCCHCCRLDMGLAMIHSFIHSLMSLHSFFPILIPLKLHLACLWISITSHLVLGFRRRRSHKQPIQCPLHRHLIYGIVVNKCSWCVGKHHGESKAPRGTF